MTEATMYECHTKFGTSLSLAPLSPGFVLSSFFSGFALSVFFSVHCISYSWPTYSNRSSNAALFSMYDLRTLLAALPLVRPSAAVYSVKFNFVWICSFFPPFVVSLVGYFFPPLVTHSRSISLSSFFRLFFFHLYFPSALTHFALYVFRWCWRVARTFFFFSRTMCQWRRTRTRDHWTPNRTRIFYLVAVKYFNIFESKANFIRFVLSRSVPLFLDGCIFYLFCIHSHHLHVKRVYVFKIVVQICRLSFFSHQLFHLHKCHKLGLKCMGWNKNENWSYVLECQKCVVKRCSIGRNFYMGLCVCVQ